MARVLRKTSKSVDDLGTAFNDLKAWLVAQLRLAQSDINTVSIDADIGHTPIFVPLGSHNDRSEVVVTAANASSLATSLVLVNNLKAVYEFHIVDTHAHLVADATNVLTEPAATDLTTAIDLANEIKAAYNAHRSESGVHPTNDSGNATAAADATDQDSLNTLLNELKTDLNAHMAGGVLAKSVRVVPA